MQAIKQVWTSKKIPSINFFPGCLRIVWLSRLQLHLNYTAGRKQRGAKKPQGSWSTPLKGLSNKLNVFHINILLYKTWIKTHMESNGLRLAVSSFFNIIWLYINMKKGVRMFFKNHSYIIQGSKTFDSLQNTIIMRDLKV